MRIIKNVIGKLMGNSRKKRVGVFKNLGANPKPSERQTTKKEWKAKESDRKRVEKPGWDFNPTVYKADNSTVIIPRERVRKLLENGKIKSDSHGVYYLLPEEKKGGKK